MFGPRGGLPCLLPSAEPAVTDHQLTVLGQFLGGAACCCSKRRNRNRLRVSGVGQRATLAGSSSWDMTSSEMNRGSPVSYRAASPGEDAGRAGHIVGPASAAAVVQEGTHR